MRKTYISPECEIYRLSSVMPLAASPDPLDISDETADEGGFSKQWGGSLFEEEKIFE